MADARVFSTAVLPCRLAGGVTTHTWLYVDSSGSKKAPSGCTTFVLITSKGNISVY